MSLGTGRARLDSARSTTGKEGKENGGRERKDEGENQAKSKSKGQAPANIQPKPKLTKAERRALQVRPISSGFAKSGD
jgi:hypothetical protein